jgi:ATP-binding cassette subfamily G (WHITE) protein 2
MNQLVVKSFSSLNNNIIFCFSSEKKGLDASTAETVMKSLYNLSRQGCQSSTFFSHENFGFFFFLLGTIIFSIHQPRYSIFKLFDRILLLSAGHTVYLGPSIDLLSYFSTIGFQCEEHNNPADFVLDVLIHSTTLLHTTYLQSSMRSKNENPSRNNSVNEILIRSYLIELYYVSIRTFRNTIRDPAMVASQIIVAVFLALLTGLVFNRIQPTIENGIQNRLGVIFFIVVNQVYSTATALESLVHEHALFIHVKKNSFEEKLVFICRKMPVVIIEYRLFLLPN